MKKFIAVTLLAIMVSTCLASCAKEFTCGMCMKDVKSKEHKEEVLGVEVSICDDCYNGLKELEDALEGLGDALGQ